MSRKQGLLIAFAIAVILAVALYLARGGGTDAASLLPAVIGTALGLFIFPGILPCLVWAFLKFRKERLRPVLVGWIALQILFAVANYYFDIRPVAGG